MANNEKIMERVAKLLALAEHPNTPEAEAETALMQANKLMTKHAIEEALIRQAQTVGERRALVRLDMEVGGGNTFRPFLRTILEWNAKANRCSVASISGGRAAVFGADEDVKWVEMLHNMIHLQFLSKINPKWDESKSYDENVYTFKVAGYKWKDIDAEAVKHGHQSRQSHQHDSWPIEDRDGYGSLEWWKTHAGTGYHRDTLLIQNKEGRWEVRRYNGFFHKLKAAYQRHAKLIGDTSPVTTQDHRAYRLSYATAFRTTMTMRFQNMINESERERDSIPGAALALRDMQEEAQRMMWSEFPHLDPEHIKRIQEEQAAAAQREAEERQRKLDAMTPKQREAFLEKEERDFRRDQKRWEKWYDRSTYVVDSGARSRGEAAAQAVDLTRKAGHAGAGGSRKEIG